MTKKNKKPGIASRAASFGPSSINTENRTVDFTLSTGNPVRVFDWDSWRMINEVLIPEGMQLPEGRTQVPLLDTHDSSSIQNIMGSVRNIRREGNEVIGTLHFESDSLSEKAFNLVRNGHLTDGSVGYLVQDYRDLAAGEEYEINGRTFHGDNVQRVVTKWMEKEFSLAPIGADEGAKARSENIMEERTNMDPKTPKVETPVIQEPTQERAAPVQPAVDTAKLTMEAEKRAAERFNTIRTECRSLGLNDADTDEVLAIADISEARAAMIERKSKMTTPIKPGSIQITADAGDKFRAAATDSLIMRSGVQVAKPAAGSQEMQLGFEGVARECVELAGHNTRGWSKQKILEVAMKLPGTRASGLPFQSSSDFKKILLDAANKSVMMGFDSIPSTYEAWCKIGNVSDFKTHNRVRLSDSSALDQVAEGENLPRKGFSDAKAVVAADEYGLITGISRKALINDDLNIFGDMQMAIGARARQQVNAYAYALLAANKLSDGSTAIWSSANTGTAGAPSATTLKEARKLMMKRTYENGTKLNVMPQFLLCGPDNIDAAQIILASQYLPSGTNLEFSPYANMATPIVDANIAGTKWYMVSAPIFPTVEIVFLNGQRVPTFEELPQGEVLGMSLRAVLDFGGSVLDDRGLFYNAGS